MKVINDNLIEMELPHYRNVSDFVKNNKNNMEFLSCIPGSIGGAIIMNSGCYGTDISNFGVYKSYR